MQVLVKISFNLTSDQKKFLEKKAKRIKIPVSNLIRMYIADDMRKDALEEKYLESEEIKFPPTEISIFMPE